MDVNWGAGLTWTLGYILAYSGGAGAGCRWYPAGTDISNFGWGGDWGAWGEYISCGVDGGGVGPGGDPQ